MHLFMILLQAEAAAQGGSAWSFWVLLFLLLGGIADLIYEEGESVDHKKTTGIRHRSYSSRDIEDMRYYEAEARFIEEISGVDIRDSIM